MTSPSSHIPFLRFVRGPQSESPGVDDPRPTTNNKQPAPRLRPEEMLLIHSCLTTLFPIRSLGVRSEYTQVKSIMTHTSSRSASYDDYDEGCFDDCDDYGDFGLVSRGTGGGGGGGGGARAKKRTEKRGGGAQRSSSGGGMYSTKHVRLIAARRDRGGRNGGGGGATTGPTKATAETQTSKERA
jgi:hypothetical protein